MGVLRIRACHIIAACIAVLFSSAMAQPSGTIPSAEDINDLAEAQRLTTQNFMRESLELRLRYEFGGKFFTTDEQEALHGLARRAGEKLHEIAQKQQNLGRRIEDYEGDDWEAIYGSTGLWRKFKTDQYVTSLSECEVGYYIALSAPRPQQNETLHRLIDRIDSAARTYDSAYVRFLKAKTLALLSRTEPALGPKAKEQFDALMQRSDLDDLTAIRMEIERIKLLGPATSDQLDQLADTIAHGSCSNDMELVLSLTFLQRRYKPEALEKTVAEYPTIEDFLGACILSELADTMAKEPSSPQQISTLEAELAAQAALKRNTQQYTRLLNQLANVHKHQTSLVLYVTAAAAVDSSPARAVELLVKAGRLQYANKSKRLNIEAAEIARQAAQLAYNFFAQDRQHCPLALDALASYASIAGENIDEELEYLYAVVLNSCGRTQQSKELLTRISERPAGRWRNRARLDLITTAVREQPQQKNEQSGKMLEQLSTLIADCNTQNESDSNVRNEALKIYCELLLGSQDDASAQKVLNCITAADTSRDPNLNVLKAKALMRMGRLNESAEYLVKVCRADDRRHVSEAGELLSEIIEQIDLLQEQQKHSQQFMKNCTTIARYCEEVALSTYGLMPLSQARLYLAEISVFAADKDQQRLSESGKLLDVLASHGLADNVDLLRCRARLLTKQGKFGNAAELWAKIAEIRKDEPAPPHQRSWKWWRAKYYELYCLSKQPQTNKQSLLHTVEVLENSFAGAPPLWAEKLESLKKKLQV
ncbi:MAG TPA: hypothetical protein VMX13_05150 [Sedimentisphaerales bacterium]|nr:hypothetical protein [Sedimentisphaerales bacterium]